MNNLLSSLPINSIRAAVSLVNDAKKQVYRLEKKLEKLGTAEDAQRLNGIRGLEARNKDAEIIAQQINAIKEDTINKLRLHRDFAEKSVDKQFIPNGNDILGDNAADVALLNAKLVKTPEKLAAILQNHNNAAFRLLASEYAKENNWNDFVYTDKEESIREYVNQVFDNLNTAAAEPLGLTSEQYTGTIGEYSRIAEAYELTEEFHGSFGNTIDDVIVTSESLAE